MKTVSVLIGSGSTGVAIARRVSAGKQSLRKAELMTRREIHTPIIAFAKRCGIHGNSPLPSVRWTVGFATAKCRPTRASGE
jgi:hypothetical protein